LRIMYAFMRSILSSQHFGVGSYSEGYSRLVPAYPRIIDEDAAHAHKNGEW